jgi:hypothetical protein
MTCKRPEPRPDGQVSTTMAPGIRPGDNERKAVQVSHAARFAKTLFSRTNRIFAVLALAASLLGSVALPSLASAVSYVPGSPGSLCAASGSGAGECGELKGVAVDQSNGNLYVADQGNFRIDEFEPSGAFVRAFGTDVVLSGQHNNGANFEVCEPANSTPTDVCKAGLSTGSVPGTVGTAARGIAVDSETHIVYMTIKAGVVAYYDGATGAFLGEFTGTAPSTSPAAPAAFASTTGVALDASAAQHYVYVATGTGATSIIDKFKVPTVSGGAVTAVPAYVCQITGKEVALATECHVTASKDGAFNGLSLTNQKGGDLAVDASGNVFLAEETARNVVSEFDSTGAFVRAIAATAPVGVATGATGRILVADGGTNEGAVHVQEFEVATASKISEFAAGTVSASLGIAAYTGGGVVARRVYVTDKTAKRVWSFRELIEVPPVADIRPATEVTSTAAKLNGTVTVPTYEGEGLATGYHFEYSADNGFHWFSAPAPDASAGSTPGPVSVSQVVTGLQPNTNYKFRLFATTGVSDTSPEENFTTSAAPPSVTEVPGAKPLTPTTAKLAGTVNPNNKSTTYHFEYGTSTSYGQQSPNFDPALSGGEAIPVTAILTDLQPLTTYHFRIVATNGAGTTNGLDQQFTTFEEPQTLNPAGLPDGRAYELVSPADKRPVGHVGNEIASQLLYQPSLDGNSVFYSLASGLPDSTAGGDLKYIARRGPHGWSSTQETPPAMIPALGTHSFTGNILFESPSLSCAIVETADALTSDTPKADIELGATNLYRRNEDGSYTLLTRDVPGNPSFREANANYYFPVLASDDCSHVVFGSKYTLPVSGSPSSGSHLYEWSAGSLRLAGVRPDGTAVAVDIGRTASRPWPTSLVNSLSPDGSRLFFSATSDAGGDSGNTAVFVRKDGTTTVDASQKQGGAVDDKGAQYQMASADGKHVFFTANYGLTTSSSAGSSTCADPVENGTTGEGCDLYDYNVETGALADLSADVNPADHKGASVAGVVDASHDGSYVYFAARGQLVPEKGNTEAQNLAGVSLNIYLSHGGTLSFVGIISSRANGDSQKAVATNFDKWVSDATPDGKHLLFVSSVNFTGYDSGGKSEAYLYSADQSENQPVCISCRSDGLPPEGNPAPIRSKGEAPNINGVVQYRPRSLSDDGSRVFFTMADVLAPGGVAGNRNIYEWQNGAVYLLTTGSSSSTLRYVDSSASGDDVFVISPSRLAPQDFDFANDLYDIRAPHLPGEAVGFAAEPPPAPPCDPLAGACQGSPAPQPGADSAPVSESGQGAGNQAVPPPRKPHSKHKKHRRHHRRQAHRHIHTSGRASR